MASNGAAEWISSAKAAEHIGVALTTLYRLVDDGKIPAYRPGRSLRFRVSDLDAFLEETKVKPGELSHLVRHVRKRST